MITNRYKGTGCTSNVPFLAGAFPFALRQLPTAGAWATLPNRGGMGTNGGKKLTIVMQQTNFPAQPLPDFVELWWLTSDITRAWSNGINYGPVQNIYITSDCQDEFFQVYFYNIGPVVSNATMDVEVLVSS